MPSNVHILPLIVRFAASPPIAGKAAENFDVNLLPMKELTNVLFYA